MLDPDHLDRARQGLWKAQQIHVRPGQYLYRFGARSRPHLWFSGAWWFEYDDYRKIVKYAEKAEITLGYAARRFAGLAYEWADCDVDGLERVYLVDRLDAWAGPGRMIRGTERGKGQKTRHYHLAPPQDIKQLYIPGLRAGTGPAAGRSPVSLKAFAHCTCDPIPSAYFA